MDARGRATQGAVAGGWGEGIENAQARDVYYPLILTFSRREKGKEFFCKRVGISFDRSPLHKAFMAKPNNTGVTRIINAAGYSWAGLKAAFKHEAAFRQELILCLALAPLAMWLGHSAAQRAIMIGSLLLVLIVELLNSAIEAAVDRIGSEHHELAGRAKDIGSAAVFIALLNVVVIWAIILLKL